LYIDKFSNSFSEILRSLDFLLVSTN